MEARHASGAPSKGRISRYELKYILRAGIVARLRADILPFVRLDNYSKRQKDGRYPVISDYLDSPDHRLRTLTADGRCARFKLRVRRYKDDTTSPAFFEIKKRLNNVVIKDRVLLDNETAGSLLNMQRVGPARIAPSVTADDEHPIVSNFLRLARMIDARPVLGIRYLREAYESRGVDPVRITFDSDLKYAVLRSGYANDGRLRWRRTRIEGVILEVKFTDRFPGWLSALARTYELDRRSVPKYVLSLDQAVARGEVKTDPCRTMHDINFRRALREVTDLR